MTRGFAVLAGIGLGAAGFAILARSQTQEPGAPASWIRCAPSMAHALGAVDDRIYTNSLEAFERNYARGFRFFETDLRRTRDGSLVLAHDWMTPERQRVPPSGPTLVEFRRARVYSRYTPLTFRDLLGLLEAHADARVTLDLKEDPRILLPAVIQAAEAVDPTLPDRIIPQVRSAEDAEVALALHNWPLILSLHQSRESDHATVALVRRLRVAAVVLNRFRLSPEFARQLRDAGAVVYISAANLPGEVSVYRAWGAAGIVTDALPPDSLCQSSIGGG